jgi:hypothetical protein
MQIFLLPLAVLNGRRKLLNWVFKYASSKAQATKEEGSDLKLPPSIVPRVTEYLKSRGQTSILATLERNGVLIK